MALKVAGRAAVIFLLFSFLSACGELDSLFSSRESYPVKVLINGSSLEECSIIRQDDTISPYFASSVADDPDLTGLLVYLRNPYGEVVGEKILYELQPYAGQTSVLADEIDEIDETGEQLPAVRQIWSFFDSKPETADSGIVIEVKSLDQEMPHFSMPANLEIGIYSIVFEALGRKEILSQSTIDIFYLGNAKFEPNDISVCFPGVFSSQMIPPGTMIMLEASLEYDGYLDPYVIWYNGKNVISEGKIKDGAGSIFWVAPEQSGFFSMRLEMFPFRLDQKIIGFYREIVLPVSSKAANPGYFFGDGPSFAAQIPLAAGAASFEPLIESPIESSIKDTLSEEMSFAEETPENEALPAPAPELLRWYQFRGDLSDTVSQDLTLAPLGEKLPRWTALGGHYGLSTGPDDACVVSPVNFLTDEQGEFPSFGGLPSSGEFPSFGGGILLFHVKPLTEDAIMSVFFPYLSSGGGVWMDVARKENAIVLRLLTGASVTEMAIHAFIKPETFITGAVEFYIRPYRLEAKLSLGDSYFPQTRTDSINLLYPLSGEGRIMLGGAAAMTPAAAQLPEPALNTDFPLDDGSDEKMKPASAAAAIWNEFAILLSATPLLAPPFSELPFSEPPFSEPPFSEPPLSPPPIREETLPEIIEPDAEEKVIEAEVMTERHTTGLTGDLVSNPSGPEIPEPSADAKITDSLAQNDFGEEKTLMYNDDEFPERAAE